MAKTLVAMRENDELTHLYRPTLKEFSRLCGHSELTILSWAKPSNRTKIYQKAEEELASGRVLQEKIFSEMSIDSKIWNDNVVKMPLCTQSQTGSSINTDDDDENENDNYNKYR